MKNLYKALAAFQNEVPVLHKGTQGYGYTYTELSDIIKTINPLLKKHGLGFSQPIEGQSIKTIIFHIESGEQIESITDIPQNVTLKGMNDFQVLGSAITYIRRYAISSILGLVTDKDTDASGEQTKPTTIQKTTAKTDDLPWLNLTNKDGSFNLEYKSLKDAIDAGSKYTLAQLKKRYRVSKQTQEILKDLGIE